MTRLTTQQKSNFAAAQYELTRLLDEHDPDATFERHLHLNRRKRGRGLCRYPHAKNNFKGRIEISRYLLENDLDDILNTVRHEVAHVIAGNGAGHGSAWKAAARRVGARPERCGRAMVSAEVVAPYEVVCADCGVIGTRHKLTAALKRKIRRCRCGQCGSPLLTVNRTSTGERVA